MEYVAKNGTVYTDEDIEKWADEAEQGFPGATFGPSSPGRPVSVGTDVKPFTLRLDEDRRAKLNKVAKEHNITASQVVRSLIDSL